MTGSIGRESMQQAGVKALLPIQGNQNTIEFYQCRSLALIAPSIGASEQVNILELQMINHLPEATHVTSVDAGIVFI